MRALLLAGLLLLGAAPALAKTLTLTLVNEDTAVLRCQEILAHFVSLPAATAVPGEALRWTWLHEPEAGTLGKKRTDGRLMLVENLLCGRDGAWDATRGEVPLLALRGLDADQARLACRVDGRLRCETAGE